MTLGVVLWTLSIAVFVGVKADFDLTILHTNDIHARIEETDKYGGPCTESDAQEGKCFGGSARINTMVKEKRAQYPNRTLLLDAGDQFQGTLWFYVFGGVVTAEFMNLIGYDAMAIGNHEFDNGIEGLAPFAHNVTFPLLSSNINIDNTPKLKGVVQKSAVLEVDGQKIGVVGYTTTETPYISRPETVIFSEELAAIQGEIDKLKSQGVNKIIALGHSGYQVDLDLGKKLKDVDIIVGGHTNTFLYTGDSPSNEKAAGVYPTVVQSMHGGEDVLVVQDYAFGKYLGELRVTFDDNGKVKAWSGNPILLDNSVQKDPAIDALVQSYLPEIESLKTEVVGQTHVDLLADRIQCRTTECNLGNVVTDAMVRQNLRHADSESWSDVGIAMVNAGSFRASITKGPITVENVIFVQPFRNTVDIIEVTGQTILDMLEYGAKQWTTNRDDAFGGFLQVAGLQITYDIQRAEGQRVVEVLAICTQCRVPRLEPLDTQKVYKVLLSSYLVLGGDGYSMLPGKVIKRHILGNLDTDIILQYIKTTSPITTGLEGRIRHLDDVKDSKYCMGKAHSLTSVNLYIIAALLLSIGSLIL